MPGYLALRPGHDNYPRFLDARLPDFFSASRVALRKKLTGWLRLSNSGVSSFSGVQRSFFICGLQFWDGDGERNCVPIDVLCGRQEPETCPKTRLVPPLHWPSHAQLNE